MRTLEPELLLAICEAGRRGLTATRSELCQMIGCVDRTLGKRLRSARDHDLIVVRPNISFTRTTGANTYVITSEGLERLRSYAIEEAVDPARAERALRAQARRGRPAVGMRPPENSVSVSCRLPESAASDLDVLAARLGCTKSALVAQMVMRGIASEAGREGIASEGEGAR